MSRTRLVWLLLVVSASWFGAVGCGGASNPTEEAVVIIQAPAEPADEAPADGAVSPP